MLPSDVLARVLEVATNEIDYREVRPLFLGTIQRLNALPYYRTPAYQLRSDLLHLNQMRVEVGEAHPLVTWLDFATQVLSPRREAEVFRRASAAATTAREADSSDALTIDAGPFVERPVAAVATLPSTLTRPALIRIPAGSFWMGELGAGIASPAAPRHPVLITGEWLMARTPVTLSAKWATLDRKDKPAGKADWPWCDVDWQSAARYCDRLSRLEGLKPAYRWNRGPVGLDPEAAGYRLPSEALWEYACRAGGQGPLSDEARPEAAVFGQTEAGPVATRESNAWGLHDMQGLVWEWVHDAWSHFAKYARRDPWGPAAGEERVLRGGGFRASAVDCRAFSRRPAASNHRAADVGFRVVRPA